MWDAHLPLGGLLENLVHYQLNDKEWQSKEAGYVVRMDAIGIGKKGGGLKHAGAGLLSIKGT